MVLNNNCESTALFQSIHNELINAKRNLFTLLNDDIDDEEEIELKQKQHEAKQRVIKIKKIYKEAENYVIECGHIKDLDCLIKLQKLFSKCNQ